MVIPEESIVVTDSGLGGFSVYAKISNSIKALSKRRIDKLTFFNCVPDKNYGYNSMKTVDEKIKVFNDALNSIYEIVRPNEILIACNTLSAIADKTDFSKSGKARLTGIINLAFETINEKISDKQNSNVIVLGTPTTIDSEQYQNFIIKNGVPGQNLSAVACPRLETAIQNNPLSNEVRELINKFMIAAVDKLAHSSETNFLILGCTHYDLAETLFEEIAENLGIKNLQIINPNKTMIEKASDLHYGQKLKTPILHSVISKVEITEKEIDTFSRLFENESKEAVDSLKSYKQIPDLF